MAAPPGWDAAGALARQPLTGWRGRAWRAHWQRYDALDPGGSLRFSGRYHRGRGRVPERDAWPALFLATGRDIALGEVVRHLTAEQWRLLNAHRISEVAVTLAAVA